MFSECHSSEDLRHEATCQRGLAAFLKDRAVAANLRAVADELDQQADLLENPAKGPQQNTA